MEIERPKAIKGHAPTLTTMHRIELVLRAAAQGREGPLSLAEIARRMPAAKVRPETVRIAVLELCRLRLASWGSKGAQWIVPEPSLARRPTDELA